MDGRAVMVTGGTGQLGGTVARRYLEAGAHVALPVRDPVKGSALAEALGALARTGERLLVLEADAADSASMERAVAAVLARWGRLDALANLAGGYDRSAAWELDAIEASWSRNFRTAAIATTACLRPMRARGYGRIVSVGARAADRGGKDSAGYAISKTALVRWTESLAAALKDEGITANVVQPSIIDTPDNRRDLPKADPRRWVSPDELASVILFLTSEAASAITGSAIPVVGRV